MRIIVDSRVHVELEGLDSEVAEEIRSEFVHRNPGFLKMKALGLPTWNEPPQIRTWRNEERETDGRWVKARARLDAVPWLSVPRGGLDRVRNVLRLRGVSFRIEDRRTTGAEIDFPNPRELPLYPYQARAVEECFAKQNCLMRAPTGSGKSRAGFAFALRAELPTLVIVWNAGLHDQWMNRARTEVGFKKKDIGSIRGKKCELRPITIAMSQTLAKGVSDEVRDYFGVVIFDECFLPDAQVLMEDGSLRLIEDICVGDRVAVGGEVFSVMCREYTGLIYRLGTTWATADHPVATARGWISVSEVSCADFIWYDPLHECRIHLCSLWKADEGRKQTDMVSETWNGIVRSSYGTVQEVWEEGSDSASRTSCVNPMWSLVCVEQGTHRGNRRQSRQDFFQITWGQTSRDISTGPREISRSEFQGETFTSRVTCTTKTLRQEGGERGIASTYTPSYQGGEDSPIRGASSRERKARHGGRKEVVLTSSESRFRSTVRCFADRRSEEGTSASLQDRSCACRDEGSDRDRWQQSHNSPSSLVRQEEGPFPLVAWLESASLPDSVRLHRGRAQVYSARSYTGRVCNLETENGVYLAGGVLVHNCQRAAARTMFESVDQFPAKYRLGISADHSRKDKKEFLTYDLFGTVASDIKRDTLIKSGHVLDVSVFVVPTEFRADWYGFAEKEDEEKELDFNRLLSEMTGDKARNALVLKCIRKEEGQVLVMSHRREHCLHLDQQLVKRGTKTGFLIGGDDYKVEFRKTVEGLENGTLRVGVGTFQAIGQGLDLPRVGSVVCTTPIAGNKQFFGQVRGRVCRTAKGKTEARLTYLLDVNVYPRHLDNLMAWNNQVKVLEAGEWIDSVEWKRMKKVSRRTG